MLLHLFTFTFFISWVFLLFFHYETADCLSDDVWKADGLYILNDENFETALHDFSIMFVNFYDPANNRSKLYTHPQMKDAAKMMEDDDIPVAFARMDCNINKEIVSYYNLTRFPTLRLFRFARIVPEEYQHARLAIEMVPWIRHKTNQITQIIRTKDDLFELQQQVNVNGVVVGLFDNFNSKLTQYFCLSAMAEKTLFFGMALTSNDDVFYEVVDKNESKAEKIFVYKAKVDDDGASKIEKHEMKIDENTHELDVWDFIKYTAHPLITTFEEEKAMKLFSTRIQLHALLFTNIELESHFKSMQVFKEVAIAQKYRCNFMNVLSNATRLMRSFDINIDELPLFYLLDMETGYTYKKFKYEGPMVADGMIKFIYDFDRGQLEGSRLRQPRTPEEIGAEFRQTEQQQEQKQNVEVNDSSDQVSANQNRNEYDDIELVNAINPDEL